MGAGDFLGLLAIFGHQVNVVSRFTVAGHEIACDRCQRRRLFIFLGDEYTPAAEATDWPTMLIAIALPAEDAHQAVILPVDAVAGGDAFREARGTVEAFADDAFVFRAVDVVPFPLDSLGAAIMAGMQNERLAVVMPFIERAVALDPPDRIRARARLEPVAIGDGFFVAGVADPGFGGGGAFHLHLRQRKILRLG